MDKTDFKARCNGIKATSKYMPGSPDNKCFDFTPHQKTCIDDILCHLFAVKNFVRELTGKKNMTKEDLQRHLARVLQSIDNVEQWWGIIAAKYNRKNPSLRAAASIQDPELRSRFLKTMTSKTRMKNR